MRPVRELSQDETKWVGYVRTRIAQVRRVARDRRDDPTFDWEAVGRHAGNDFLYLKPGPLKYPGKKYVQNWPAPSVDAILCRGRDRLWEQVEQVPKHIREAVARGIATVKANGARVLFTADDIARALKVTMADRERLKVWLIGAIDCSHKKREAIAKAKKRAKDRERQAEKRLAQGRKSRTEYLYAASLRREACDLAGISLATFKRRPPEEREQILNAARSEREPSPSRKSSKHITATHLAHHKLNHWTETTPSPYGHAAKTEPPLMVAHNQISFDASRTDPGGKSMQKQPFGTTNGAGAPEGARRSPISKRRVSEAHAMIAEAAATMRMELTGWRLEGAINLYLECLDRSRNADDDEEAEVDFAIHAAWVYAPEDVHNRLGPFVWP